MQIAPYPQPDHREHQGREDCGTDQCGGGGGAHVPGVGRQRGDREHQGQLRRAHQCQRQSRARRQGAPVEQEDGRSADHEEQAEEHQQLDHRTDARVKRRHVELHSTDDEEERDEHTERDTGELGVKRGDLPRL